MVNLKDKGSFYTPIDLASWMTKRAVFSAKKVNKRKKIKVLEPSCGDGVFLNVFDGLSEKQCTFDIDAIEKDEFAFEKNRNIKFLGKFFNEDFLFWESSKKYNVIIGNPPFIVKRFLNPDQATRCKEIHVLAGLKNREVANIWTSFVLKCENLLEKDGLITFVLPTELLQVNYAKEIREFLLSNFERVEIISFKNLAFDTIDQDTVILTAYKKSFLDKGLYFAEVESIDELNNNQVNFEKHHGDHEAKWSTYILSEDEILFVKNIVSKCPKISDVCTSVAGIVTAANDFFILSEEDVENYDLSQFVKPIIRKGLYVNGSAQLLRRDYNQLKRDRKPCYILDLNLVAEDQFTDGLNRYLLVGEEQEIPARYKCQLRKRWYDVPSIWKSEGFFFKRGHKYPKLVVNKANVHVTDSAYRIRMNEGEKIENLVFSFYNSLTLLCSELNGRYYGGGVLELTPNEFKSLPIPSADVSSDEYNMFINTFENKVSIESFLEESDRKIMSSIQGVSDDDILRVSSLYQKVKNRRLRRSVAVL